jgi:hypothetical protein
MSYDVDETIPLQGIQDALQRVLASRDFRNSERKRRFLKFVVQETLAGRADRIKAYSIALDAFDRDPSFNPGADPVVRIEAGRLRRCLEHYSLAEGAADRIRITIPKGSYVPHFIVTGEAAPSVLKALGDADPPTAGQRAEMGAGNQSCVKFTQRLSAVPKIAVQPFEALGNCHLTYHATLFGALSGARDS